MIASQGKGKPQGLDETTVNDWAEQRLRWATLRLPRVEGHNRLWAEAAFNDGPVKPGAGVLPGDPRLARER